MKRTWFRTLFTASSLAALPTAAFAQGPAGPAAEPAALFKKLDADADGKLEKDELPDEHRRLFERLVGGHDTDKDGSLSEAEFKAGMAEGRPRGEGPSPGGERPRGDFNPEMIFRNADRNGDGKLVPDEVPEERRERFREMLSRVDENKDGAASLEEFRRGFGGPGAGRPGEPSQPGRPGQPGQQGQPGISGGGLLAALDTDRNGELSSEEVTAAAESLKKLDRDGDGKVTQRELFPPRPEGGPDGGRPDPERMLGFMKQQDRDGDGKLSKEEVGERMRANFDRIDTNGDGRLDDTELKQMIARMTPPDGGRRPEGRPNADGKPAADGERRREGRPFNEEEAKARFKAADKNEDGQLSKEELPESLREHFEKIDVNRDGSIGPVEMHDAMRRMMERRDERRPEGDRPRERSANRDGDKPAAEKPGDERRPESRREGAADEKNGKPSDEKSKKEDAPSKNEALKKD